MALRKRRLPTGQGDVTVVWLKTGFSVDARDDQSFEQKISGRRPLFPDEQRLFVVPFPSAVKRTMKNKNDVEISWQQNEQNYLNVAIGFYELSMLDEAEAELRKINPCGAAQSVPVLALRLMISYSRSDWNGMKAIARSLFLLDPSNPQWSFSDGYATAKIDSADRQSD